MRRRSEFSLSTFEFLARIVSRTVLKARKGATPVNLFEGVSAGAALALAENANPAEPSTDVSWVRSDELRRLTTGATNSR